MRRALLTISAIAAMSVLAACSDDSQNAGGVIGSGSSQGVQGPGGAQGGYLSEAERIAQAQRDFQAQVGDRVLFGLDSVSLDEQSRQILNRQVAFLNQYPSIVVRIEGHADERGTREYNLALGDRRAQAVKEYLVARGISASRIATSSYGKERPEAIGSNESAWAQNRRSVTVLVGQYAGS